MIKDSLIFTYDGRNSSDYNLTNVNYETGLFEEDFLPEQELYMEQIPGRDDPYYLGNKKLPLQINLSFYLEEGFSDIREISQWLFQDYYKPMIFSNVPNKIYYCKYVGESNLLHSCNDEGLILITMRNIDSYSRSPMQATTMYENTNEIEINNAGDTKLFPIVELEILENIDIFTIVNDTNNTALKFEDLLAGDKLEIDLLYKMINATNGGNKIYRYDNLTLNTFELEVGANDLFISKKNGWKVKFKYQYRYL